jgi:hypothetical protein
MRTLMSLKLHDVGHGRRAVFEFSGPQVPKCPLLTHKPPSSAAWRISGSGQEPPMAKAQTKIIYPRGGWLPCWRHVHPRLAQAIHKRLD